jgi:hypothetical protein
MQRKNVVSRLSLLITVGVPFCLVPSCKGEYSVPGDEPEVDCSKLPACLGGRKQTGGNPNLGAGGEGGAQGGGSGESGADTGTGGSPQNCDGAEPALDFRPIPIPGYQDAADFVFLPEKGHLLFAERHGLVRELELQGTELREVRSASLPDAVHNKDACGLTNLLLDPEFEENRFVYVSYCTSSTVTRLSRVTYVDGGLEDLQVIVESKLENPTGGWHRFGSMGFEADGRTLWVLSGEQTQKKQAQELDSKRGKLLRIVPTRKSGEGGYDIPPGNMGDPEVSDLGDKVDPAVFALGFRSPWRATRDAKGHIWVGDVGNAYAEEVNLVERAGQNFGWATYEGPCLDDCDGFENPVAWYDRSLEHPYVFDDPLTEPATKRAIWVGEIAHIESAPERYCGVLDQVLPFGDFFTGWVRGIGLGTDGSGRADFPLGHLPTVTSWREGPDGYAYVLTLNGVLSRVELHIPEP